MISDDTIANAVKIALAMDARVGSMDITVHSHRGQVQIQGDVASDAQVQAAEEIARAVTGVREVHNNLRVTRFTPGMPVAEEA